MSEERIKDRLLGRSAGLEEAATILEHFRDKAKASGVGECDVGVLLDHAAVGLRARKEDTFKDPVSNLFIARLSTE